MTESDFLRIKLTGGLDFIEKTDSTIGFFISKDSDEIIIVNNTNFLAIRAIEHAGFTYLSINSNNKEMIVRGLSVGFEPFYYDYIFSSMVANLCKNKKSMLLSINNTLEGYGRPIVINSKSYKAVGDSSLVSFYNSVIISVYHRDRRLDYSTEEVKLATIKLDYNKSGVVVGMSLDSNNSELEFKGVYLNE